MVFERFGFRGLSEIYQSQADEPRGLRGLDAITPPSHVMAQIAPVDVETKDLTRSMLRMMASNYRMNVTSRARQVRNAIQPIMEPCIGGKSILDGSIQSACEKNVSPERLLTPLGVINVLDVPLPITDLLNVGEDGVLERSYTPNQWQKWNAGYQAYLTSQAQLLFMITNKDVVAARAKEQSNHIENIIADADPNGVPYELEDDRKRYGLLGLIHAYLGHLSINNLGEFTTHAEGFPLNPLEPRKRELEEPGGLYLYYRRGGYLLYKPALGIIKGSAYPQIPIRHGELHFTSGYFLCPDGKLAAATEKIPDEGHGWYVSVTFGPGQWKIQLKMKDRSTWEGIKKAVKDVVKKVMGTICQLQPLAQTIAQASLSAPACKRTGIATPQQKMMLGCTQQEIMAPAGSPMAKACDAKVYTCKQGEPNCICTGPSQQTMMQQQAMLAAGAAVLSGVCKAMAPNAPIPCPPPMPPPTVIPWWLIAGGVALVGAALYKRNQASKEA